VKVSPVSRPIAAAAASTAVGADAGRPWFLDITAPWAFLARITTSSESLRAAGHWCVSVAATRRRRIDDVFVTDSSIDGRNHRNNRT
jgi:hypothetical protein